MANETSSITRRDSLKLAGKTFDNLVRPVETVEYLKRMVGADHVMVGTDYPFDLGDSMAAEKIQTMNCTAAEREAMLHGIARALIRIPGNQHA